MRNPNDKTYANHTAAGMVRDALSCLVENGWVQNLRNATNVRDEITPLLDFAQNALSYFENCYSFAATCRTRSRKGA